MVAPAERPSGNSLSARTPALPVSRSDLGTAFRAERRAGGQRRTAVPARHLGGWSGARRRSAARRWLPRRLPVWLRHHRLHLVLSDDEVDDQPDDPEQEDDDQPEDAAHPSALSVAIHPNRNEKKDDPNHDAQRAQRASEKLRLKRA